MKSRTCLRVFIVEIVLNKNYYNTYSKCVVFFTFSNMTIFIKALWKEFSQYLVNIILSLTFIKFEILVLSRKKNTKAKVG